MPKDTFFNLPQDKRARILEVLLDEFSEKDYKSVSISGIADQAGIAKGSFYQYFEDKQDCYLYLIQLGIEEKIAFMSNVPQPGGTLDIFAYLRLLLDVGMRFEFSNPRLARISYRALFDDVPLPEETLAVIRASSLGYFRQLIQKDIQAGNLRQDIDADLAAFMFNTVFTNLGGYLLDRYAVDPGRLLGEGAQVFDNDALRVALDQAIAILEHGLRKPTDVNSESKHD